MLTTGEYEAALERIGPEGDAAPTDAVLRLLYQGTVAYHAGRYEESARALDIAHYISETRYTRRLGTGLVSLVTNDRVLPYVPDRTERLLIHYYSALSYLKLDQPDEAAVEARRLGLMLDRYADEPPLRDHADLVAHMRLVAALLFEAAGERNDADVAYRLAYAAAGDTGMKGLATTLAAANPSAAGSVPDVTIDDVLPALLPGDEGMDPDSMGEVIVLIERGFIAPRIQEEVDLAIWEHELEAVGIAGMVARAGTATCIANYVMADADPLTLGGGRFEADDDDIERCVPVPDDWDERQRQRQDDGDDDEDDYEHDGRPVPAPEMNRPPATVVRGALEPPQPKNTAEVRGPAALADDPDIGRWAAATAAGGPEREFIRLALPTYPVRAGGLAPVASSAFMSISGLSADALRVSLPIDLSACVMDEFAADAPFVLAKAIARSVARQSIARGFSDAKGDGEVLGDVLGFLVGAAGDAMERADTRSWSLLPGSLGVARLRLPVGEHPIVLNAGGTGAAAGCDLGTVRVEAGRTPILSCRVWN